jgi:hypothetical protein
LLLEVAILRYARFADCGQTIWELLPTFSWYSTNIPSVAYIRAWNEFRASRRDGPLPTIEVGEMTPLTGRQAIEIIESAADGEVVEDQLLRAQDYFRYAEYAAEADRFGYDPERLPGSELRYGVAYWLYQLAHLGPELSTVLDFYLANYPGTFYCWGGDRPLHPGHQAAAVSVIHDLFGNPLRRVTFDPAWRTDTAVSLARQMYESRDFFLMPILADALQDAGCEHGDILDHCRDPNGTHVRGCWVVDLVLGKQ